MPEDTNNNNRSTQWFTVAAFSTIALVALTTDADKISDENKETKWAVSAASIGLTFSALAVFANLLLKDKFVGTPIEGGLALLTCGFWAAGLPGIMDPENVLATAGSTNEIYNANLYFFSWGAFLMSFMVLAGYAKDRRGGGDFISDNQVWTWTGLLATSFVAMVAASRMFQDLFCDDDDRDELDICKRVKFAVSLGSLSVIIAASWIIVGRCVHGRMAKWLDALLAWTMFVFWIFGIGYITFGGDEAPAQTLGNLYFFTWGSFCLTVVMAMSSLKNIMGGGNEEEAPAKEEEEKKAEEDVAAPAENVAAPEENVPAQDDV